MAAIPRVAGRGVGPDGSSPTRRRRSVAASLAPDRFRDNVGLVDGLAKASRIDSARLLARSRSEVTHSARPFFFNTDAVLTRFTIKILEDESAREGKLTPEQFKKLVNEVKAETGAKGKELFHPIRIVVTGSHSGPEFDKLIPILEEGSHLPPPRRVLSVCERVEEFAKARTK